MDYQHLLAANSEEPQATRALHVSRPDRREYERLYYAANKEKIAARQKRFREAHKEELAARNKRYHEANREKKLAYHKLYREAHKEQIISRERLYREANKEKINERVRQREIRQAIQLYEEAKAWMEAHPKEMAECPLIQAEIIQTTTANKAARKAITFEEFERRFQRWSMSVRSPDDFQALPALIEDLVDSYEEEHSWLRRAIKVLTSWPFKLSNREITDILKRAVSQS